MAGVEGERELEEFLTGVLENRAEGELNEEPVEEPQEPGEEPVEVIHDEGPGFVPPPEETPPEPEAVKPEAEEEPGEEADSTVAWATKRFGSDPEKWAKALYEREQHISRLSGEKAQAENYAREAIQYAQQIESQAEARAADAMPMSAAEEEWVETAMANPAAYAYQAARQGNVNLYNAVLERVAAENPRMAVQVGTSVQMALREEQARYEASVQGNGTGSDFNTDIAGSVQRMGIDLPRYGEAMSAKIDELGEHNEYVQAILGGDPHSRDIALKAIYDIVREGQTHTRRVDTNHEDQIRREGELRREAAGIVTGSPHVAPPKEDPFFAGMEAEWRRRGQWYDEET